MADYRQRFGKQSEDLAIRHLEKNGYKILERNYRNRLGEIDIIARDGRTFVFVEVKARGSGKFGNPKWAVTSKKKRRTLSMVALYWLKQTRRTSEKARFDVVAIRSEPDGPDIEIIKSAFELAY